MEQNFRKQAERQNFVKKTFREWPCHPVGHLGNAKFREKIFANAIQFVKILLHEKFALCSSWLFHTDLNCLKQPCDKIKFTLNYTSINNANQHQNRHTRIQENVTTMQSLTMCTCSTIFMFQPATQAAPRYYNNADLTFYQP